MSRRIGLCDSGQLFLALYGAKNRWHADPCGSWAARFKRHSRAAGKARAQGLRTHGAGAWPGPAMGGISRSDSFADARGRHELRSRPAGLLEEDAISRHLCVLSASVKPVG